MKARIAASIVIAAGIALGTAGCNFLTPQATNDVKTTSVGVQGVIGSLDIRNALLVSDGTDSNLVATIINTGSSSATLTVAPQSDSSTQQSVKVPGNGTVVISAKESVQFDGLNAKPGTLYPIYFQYSGAEGATLKLPVVDSQLDMFSTLTPTPVPSSPDSGAYLAGNTPVGSGTTPSPDATSSDTPTPAATPAG